MPTPKTAKPTLKDWARGVFAGASAFAGVALIVILLTGNPGSAPVVAVECLFGAFFLLVAVLASAIWVLRCFLARY
jgi:preprotein translocase subunit SecD